MMISSDCTLRLHSEFCIGSWPDFRQYPGISLEMGKPVANDQHRPYPFQNLNPEPPTVTKAKYYTVSDKLRSRKVPKLLKDTENWVDYETKYNSDQYLQINKSFCPHACPVKNLDLTSHHLTGSDADAESELYAFDRLAPECLLG